MFPLEFLNKTKTKCSRIEKKWHGMESKEKEKTPSQFNESNEMYKNNNV